MRQAVMGIRRRGESLFGSLFGAAKDRLCDARERRPWFDHHVRALQRYRERRGDRLAAAVTCYAFLSFFPLLALAYSLLGYLVGVSGQARSYFVQAVNSLLPGLAGEIRVEEIAQSKTTVGIIGLAALLITGQGWVQVLREGLRDIWGNEPGGGGNFFVKRLWDLSVLVFLGVVLIGGMAVSTVTTSATSTVLGWVGLQDVPGAGTGLRLLSLACAIAFNTVIFLVLFSRLSGTRAPWRRIIRGALFGAVGFEALKQIAALLVARVTENPVYGTFAVLVGLMVWMNLAARFTLFAAAWTATRRVVLTADAANPENIADRAESAALQARAEANGAGDDAGGRDESGQEEPGRDQPGRDQPGRDQPGRDQPGRDQPGRDKPGRDQPGQDQKASSAY